MGSGKTTIGRALAKKLNKSFIDSDHEIEVRTGNSISMIFNIEGEEGFRRHEVKIISEFSLQNNIVLATGGGAILDSKTRAILKQRGTVIYLRASVNQLLHRTIHDKNRPLLLQTMNPRIRLIELLRQRDPYYREIANLIVETSRPNNLQYLVETIIRQLN